MTRIFKVKGFARFQRKERLSDATLCKAIAGVEAGLIDADLGGGLIKQRLPRAGQGKSGGYRMLIAFRWKQRAIFLFGFAKNERDNIDDKQLATLQDIAAAWLTAWQAPSPLLSSARHTRVDASRCAPPRGARVAAQSRRACGRVGSPRRRVAARPRFAPGN